MRKFACVGEAAKAWRPAGSYSGIVLDPYSLYSVDPDVRDSLRGERPVLLHLLDGYIDAGSVTRDTRLFLLDHCEHEVLAEFDVDQLHDYRSRRPQFVFDTNHWSDLVDYSLSVYKLTDANGVPFLLLGGPEPDSQWHRAAAAVLELCQELDVRMLVTTWGVPMAVPHTRPTLVTQHATDPSIVTGNPVWIDRVQLPGSFSHMLEYLAGKEGFLARGFVAHVPHYLAQTVFPQAVLEVLHRVLDATGLDVPLVDIEMATAENLLTIAGETSSDSDFPALVKALEEQYDRLRESGAASVPSAEEIGAAVEQFLAEQDPPERPR